MDITTTQGMKQALTDKLRLGFGVTPEEADDAQVMRAAALVLRDVHGMTYEEIAEILDVNLNTVKSRISRARAALRAILSEGRNFPAGRASKGAEGRDGK